MKWHVFRWRTCSKSCLPQQIEDWWYRVMERVRFSLAAGGDGVFASHPHPPCGVLGGFFAVA